MALFAGAEQRLAVPCRGLSTPFMQLLGTLESLSHAPGGLIWEAGGFRMKWIHERNIGLVTDCL